MLFNLRKQLNARVEVKALGHWSSFFFCTSVVVPVTLTHIQLCDCICEVKVAITHLIQTCFLIAVWVGSVFFPFPFTHAI